MNTYTEKWNRNVDFERSNDEKLSFDYFKHLKTPYFTTIKPSEHKSKPIFREIDSSSSTKYNDKHYNHYKKHKKEKSDDTKDNAGNNKFQRRLVGYSKYNLNKESIEASRGEEINNNMIIRKNLEKKNSIQRENVNDNVCDSKSINSLETQNTINEEEINEEPSFNKSKKFQSEDLKQLKEKNLKLNYINSHNFDFNKYKEKNIENSPVDECSFRKHHSDSDGFLSNKFSQPVGYNNAFDFSRGTTPFGNYLFNPFLMEGSFPMFTPPPQFGFGSFLQSYYYINNMGFPSNGNIYNQNFHKKNTQNKEKKNIMDELTQLKEECEKLNKTSKNIMKKVEENPFSDMTVSSKGLETPITELKKHEKINKTNITNTSIITISIKLSSSNIKTLSLSSTADAFTVAKQFCRENALSEKLFYSIYKRINVALDTLISLPKNNERQLKDLLINTSQILAKVKRSHSFNCPSKRVCL